MLIEIIFLQKSMLFVKGFNNKLKQCRQKTTELTEIMMALPMRANVNRVKQEVQLAVSQKNPCLLLSEVTTMHLSS